MFDLLGAALALAAIVVGLACLTAGDVIAAPLLIGACWAIYRVTHR